MNTHIYHKFELLLFKSLCQNIGLLLQVHALNFCAMLFVSRTFLKELEAYTDCPELVGRCFLERVRSRFHVILKSQISGRRSFILAPAVLSL